MLEQAEPKIDERGRVRSLPTPQNREDLVSLLSRCEVHLPGILAMRISEQLADAVISILALANVAMVPGRMDAQQMAAATEAARGQKNMADGLQAAYSAAVASSPMYRNRTPALTP